MKYIDFQKKRIINYLNNLSVVKYYFTTIVFTIFFLFFISYVIDVFGEVEEVPFLENSSIYLIFIITVLIVPIFETLIFQTLIISYFKNKFSITKTTIISAIIFSLFHIYSIEYIIGSFFIGLNFAFFYSLSTINKKTNPTFHVISLHFFTNFVSFIINDLIK